MNANHQCMLRSLLRLIVTIPVIVLLLGFMILNRYEVQLTYSPLHDPINMPIMVIALACVIVGFLAGAWLVWVDGGRNRKEISKLKKQVKKLNQVSEIKNNNQSISISDLSNKQE